MVQVYLKWYIVLWKIRRFFSKGSIPHFAFLRVVKGESEFVVWFIVGTGLGKLIFTQNEHELIMEVSDEGK